MKGMKSVFGKVVVSIILVFGLVAGSCNTRRSEEIRVKEHDDGSKEMRMEEHMENDSVSFEREKTIKTDEDGYGKTKVETDVEKKSDSDLERDRD
jgi:AAA15 family ATPase/GTPase